MSDRRPLLRRWLGQCAKNSGDQAHTNDTKVIRFNKHDGLNLCDLFSSILVSASVGAGKSTSVFPLMNGAMLRIGGSLVIPTVKPDDTERYTRQAERAGRGEDIRVFRVEGDAFNALAFEQSQLDDGGGQIESLVSLITLPLQRQRRMGTGGDPHWKVASEELTRSLATIFILSGTRLSFRLIHETINTLPMHPDEVHDPDWQRSCPAWAALKEAEVTAGLSGSQRQQLNAAGRHLLRVIPRTPAKTLMSIVQTISASLSPFVGELGEMINAEHDTWSPLELIEAPQVFILDIPTQVYGPLGETLQRMIITSIQRAIIRRRPDEIVPPAIMFSIDEYPQICDPDDDIRFLATGRDRRSFMCLGIQSLSALRNGARDVSNPQAAEGLFSAPAIKVMGATADVEMLDLCSRQFSTIPKARVSFGGSRPNGREGGESRWRPGQNYNLSIDLQPDVPGHEYLALKRGGPENNYICEFYVSVAGRIWKASGKSSLKLAIRQRFD